MIGGAKGIGIGIDFGIPNQYCRATSKPYIEKDVLDSLRVVASAYGKSNDDADRSIVKNLVDASNPFIISNAAFKLNSGFGKYETELSDTKIWTQSKETTSTAFSSSYNGLSGWIIFANTELTNSADMPSFKIQVKGLLEGQELIYRYYDSTGQTNVYSMTKDGEYTLPADVRTAKPLTSNTSGFQIVKNETNTITITQIPSFEGAFVTDGVDNLITSTKTVQEMLGGSNEITVVSMMANLDSRQILCNSNFSKTNGYNVRNTLEPNGVISMLGYTDKNGTTNNLNLIMGDKDSIKLVDKVNFNSDYVFYPAQYYKSYYQVAWYWTFIANKVLTTDQINQVIAYFNLDRTLNPDILCNTIKQGITNENHAEFGDKLIDFSGNGRDIQLNNIAWDGDSGIGKYNYPNWKVTATIANTYSTIVYYPTVNGTYSINVNGVSELMQSIGLHLEIKYTTSTGIIYKDIKQDGVYSYILPDGATDLTLRFGGIPGIVNEPCNITITQIPSHAGALCLDGVSDFGKVTRMPVYKDYTVVTDREIFANIGAISSKNNPGAFVETAGNSVYSFGQATSGLNFISTRSISYLSKYSYCGQSITAGAAEDGTDMWLGTIRDNDTRFFNGAIYSLMSFPYSMSEFLIERQLKKYKLGTLYPDMVEFRPIVKSNNKWDIIEIWQGDKSLYRPTVNDDKTGIYLKKDSTICIYVKPKDADEVTKIVVNGTEYTNLKINSNGFYYVTLPITKSPQKINITIDEYIRFEDIVQPYPVLLRFKDENGNEVSWGGKFKVGSTITRIGSIADPERNLLNGLYSISGLSLNGKAVTSSTSIVEKQMVFRTTATWLLDDNEPKVILSPSRLRIPNSSYKLLGYIPDISGHGNHGKINNSAYAEGSGVNEDGSYQFDGVDDSVTIPTTVGGKQVLMKVNLDDTIANAIIYDQRGYPNEFAIYNGDKDNSNNPVFAYQARNTGQTYIDGILNSNIKASELKAITHNITITNKLSSGTNNSSPTIGSNRRSDDFFTKMALYDFMLFDNISTDDKIKELNEYVGIEAKVELPPYYWDAYGKTNLDADKATIQQRGVAVGNYDLTNYNHAYDKMSGYGGYSFSPFSNTNDWQLSSSDNTMELLSIDGYSFTARRLEGSTWWKYRNKVTTNVSKNLTIKIRTNKSVRINWELKYRTSEMPDADSTLGLVSTLLSPNVITDVVLPVKTEEELNTLGAISHFYLIFFPPIDVPVGEEYTVEMLPLYPNGLVYDGITDYSENANIPALDDFTAIIKREWLKKQGCPLIKGSKVYEGGNGNALLLEWDKAYNFVFYKRTDIMEGELPDNISFITPTNYNGNVITRGSEQDTNGICIAGDGNAGFANMVFYKLILYPKTIPLLQINFLKNLMERDEIIDLNNPIFIQE